ncbi:ATP-binding protein [Microbacter sp. GSS18]|nr:ATP-binding protein [Microbacter sp. GSS18]
MDSTQLALLALLAGVIIGCAITLLVVAAILARDKVRADAASEIPDGVREVLHGMDDAAIVVDNSYRVHAASGAAVPFGFTEGSTLPDQDVREVVRQARHADSARETLRVERGQPPAEARLVVVRATRISPRLTLVVMRDITERERVEQMRRDFVANTSHELKTPVGAVSLLAEAIESAADDPEQVRVFASRLTAEAARLAALTNRIMNLSRLQSDDNTPDADVSIDEVLAAALEAHALQAASAGVTVVRGGKRGLYVRGDAQILIDAIGNLISNAIAYSSAGSDVGVGVRLVEGIVEVAVTDRGIGIAEEDQRRIFERFYRADQARSRRTGGTGLGLSIVKHAVGRHGGEVRLWSRPGRGSTFTVRLPATAAPDDLPRDKRDKKNKKKKKKKSVA